MFSFLLFVTVTFMIISIFSLSFIIRLRSKNTSKLRIATTETDCQIENEIIDISSYKCCSGTANKYIEFVDLTLSPNPLPNVIELCGNICTEGINPDDPTKCNTTTSEEDSNQLTYTACLSLYKCNGDNVIVATSNTVPYYANYLGRSPGCTSFTECGV